jgi:hypothetical protein
VVFDAAGTPVDVAAFTPTATGDIPPGLTFTVPDRTAGSKTVEVKEVISDNLIVSTTFTVTSTIYVTPPSGPAVSQSRSRSEDYHLAFLRSTYTSTLMVTEKSMRSREVMNS